MNKSCALCGHFLSALCGKKKSHHEITVQLVIGRLIQQFSVNRKAHKEKTRNGPQRVSLWPAVLIHAVSAVASLVIAVPTLPYVKPMYISMCLLCFKKQLCYTLYAYA